MTHCFEGILVHSHTQGQTNENGWMDKALLFTVTPPTQMAGFLCTTRELWAVLSNLLEPGRVLARAPTATPTVVRAHKVPPGP